MDARQRIEGIRGMLIVGVLLGWALAGGVAHSDGCLNLDCDKPAALAGLLMVAATLLLTMLVLVTRRRELTLPNP